MRKIIIILISIFGIAFFIFGFYNIYDINKRFPQAEDECYTENQEVGFQGGELTVLESEILNSEGLEEKYPDWDLSFAEQLKNEGSSNYLILKIKIENKKDYSINRFSITDLSLMEGKYHTKGMVPSIIISSLKGNMTLEPGEEKEFYIGYNLEDYFVPEEDDEYKLILNYYPMFKYIKIDEEMLNESRD